MNHVSEAIHKQQAWLCQFGLNNFGAESITYEFPHLRNVCAKPISMKNGRKSFAQPVAFPFHSVIVSSEVQMLSFKLWHMRAAATP